MQKTDVTHETRPWYPPVVPVVCASGMTVQFEAVTVAGTVRPVWGRCAAPAPARTVRGSASIAAALPTVRTRIKERITASTSLRVTVVHGALRVPRGTI
jgi:hypothetical protein